MQEPKPWMDGKIMIDSFIHFLILVRMNFSCITAVPSATSQATNTGTKIEHEDTVTKIKMKDRQGSEIKLPILFKTEWCTKDFFSLTLLNLCPSIMKVTFGMGLGLEILLLTSVKMLLRQANSPKVGLQSWILGQISIWWRSFDFKTVSKHLYHVISQYCSMFYLWKGQMWETFFSCLDLKQIQKLNLLRK